MAGPPSQAGRFKPRKPAKKIQIGATTPAAQREAPAPAAAPSRSSSAPGNGRGRGRGRAGRAPTPHGTVFFTGNAPPTVASKKEKSTPPSLKGTSTAKSSKTRTKGVAKKESIEEVVVGELDVGIGGSHVVQPTVEETKKASLPVKCEERETTRKASKFEHMVDTYDSDSSEEEQHGGAMDQANVTLPPTELPFPVTPLPVGIGGAVDKRSIMYACQQPEESKHEKNESVLMELQKDAPVVSPFVDWKDAKLRQEERDSWFILQFPTRLPELQGTGTAIPDPIKSEDPMVVSSLVPDATQSMPDSVSTPSTVNGTFDNSMARAPAGRLGKIVVYKSGKTELVMGDDDGSQEVNSRSMRIRVVRRLWLTTSLSSLQIRMNVSEGLPCGFTQQAVVIDMEESTYIPLGDVKKTIVFTPNVESAFGPSL